jgi:hypothetical protein
MAPVHSAEVLPSIPKHKKGVAYLRKKIYMSISFVHSRVHSKVLLAVNAMLMIKHIPNKVSLNRYT